MCEDEETPKCRRSDANVEASKHADPCEATNEPRYKKSKMDKEKSKPTLAQPSTAEKDPN